MEATRTFLRIHARIIEIRLAELTLDGAADGGWPLTWAPPGPGPTLAWRGVVTLHALRVLRAYGRD